MLDDSELGYPVRPYRPGKSVFEVAAEVRNSGLHMDGPAELVFSACPACKADMLLANARGYYRPDDFFPAPVGQPGGEKD